MSSYTKRRRDRNNFHDLSDLYDVWDAICPALIVVIVILALWLLICGFISSNNRADAAYNEHVEFFNSLSTEQRQYLAENSWGLSEDDLDSDYVAQKRDVGLNFIQLVKISNGWVIGLTYLGLAIATFIALIIKRCKTFYISDTPFFCDFDFARLWLMMLPLVPLLLILKIFAAIDLKCRSANEPRDEESERTDRPRYASSNNEDESDEPSRLPLAEYFAKKCTQLSADDYYEIVSTNFSEMRLARIAHLEGKIDELNSENAEMHNEMKANHAIINDTKATIAHLRNCKDLDPKDLAYEFDAIKQVRGVIGITKLTDSNDNQTIGFCVLVAIHAPCANRFYDFGEWLIKINLRHNSIYADPYRNLPNNFPYLESGNFCFGDRKNTLDELMQNSRYLDAIILATEAMRHVNEQSLERGGFLEDMQPLTDQQLLSDDILDDDHSSSAEES